MSNSLFPKYLDGTLTIEHPAVLSAVAKAEALKAREDKATCVWVKPSGACFVTLDEDGPLQGCALIWTSEDGFSNYPEPEE